MASIYNYCRLVTETQFLQFKWEDHLNKKIAVKGLNLQEQIARQALNKDKSSQPSRLLPQTKYIDRSTSRGTVRPSDSIFQSLIFNPRTEALQLYKQHQEMPPNPINFTTVSFTLNFRV